MTEQPPQSRMMVLLFTDIVGSVDLKRRLGDAAAAKLISRHDAVFRQAMAETPSAEVLKDTGDGFLARFATVSDAVCFALRFQYALHQERWGEGPQSQPGAIGGPGSAIGVRIGLHLGEVSELELERTGHAKVSGLTVDLAARVMGLAAGGQILMTRAAFDNARQYVREHPVVKGGGGDELSPPLTWMAHGTYVFKGSDDPLEIYEVGAVGIAPLHEPPNSEKSKRAVRLGEEEMLGWRPGAGLEVPGRTGWFLDHRLGEGGFGEVWLGQHKKTKVRRAFKFCYDLDRLRSLKRELTLFRLLREVLGDRPDIARLYEVRLDRAPYFLECEFTELGNFVEWAKASGGIDKVPLPLRLEMMTRTAKAVAAAHSVGVLHKDIKPSNILIYEAEDKHPRPRLADFGIGVLTDPSQLEGRDITVAGFTDLMGTNESSRTGTRMYAPPETLVGKPFTVQGDIYALGVLLYQVVIGDLDRPLASGWEDDVPDAMLRDDIARCVEGDETQRLRSAQELVDRLETQPQRRRAARRRKLARFSAASAVILAVLLSLAGSVLWRERELRHRAEDAQRQTKLINDFLGDMLGSIDPSLAGHDVTVAAVLEEAAKDVDHYEKQPLIQASLHRLIGHTYLRLTSFDEAEPHLKAAWQIRERELTPPHPDLAESLNDWADWLWWNRRLSEAAPLYQQALEMRQAIFGSDWREEVAESLTGLAACQMRLGQPEPAEQGFRRALEIRRKIAAGSDPPVAGSVRKVAASLNNLGKFFRNHNRPNEADQLLREALQIVRDLPGSNPFDVGRAEDVLADFLAEFGDAGEAQQLYRDALKHKLQRAGPDHQSVALTLHRLAALQLQLNQIGEAEELCQRALKIRRDSRSPDLADSLQLQGRILLARRDATGAEQPLRESLKLRATMETQSLVSPGTAYHDAAELLATAETQSLLGQCLALQDKFAEAEPLLLTSFEALKAQRTLAHKDTQAALQRVIDLYERSHDADKARKYRDMLAQAKPPESSSRPN